MKELPYFRFTPSEWQNGKISLEDYELQGFFIQVCCYYWISDCSITLAMLSKRYRYDKALIEQCIDLGIFEHDKVTDFITISFLNEQFDSLSEARKRRQYAGSQGGTKKGANYSNAKAKLKQSCSYKDKDKDKDKDERENTETPPPQNYDFSIPTSEIEKYMNSQEQIMWFESYCMNNHLTPEQLQKKITEFVKDLQDKNITTKEKKDLFSHFTNWNNGKQRQNKSTNYTGGYSGTGTTLKPVGGAEKRQKDFTAV